jgi:hypothetical protein
VAWDIKISEFQDLVYTPGRDLQTLTGEALISQRIFVRLKINQGSWIFDEDDTLGSNLYIGLHLNETQALEQIPLLVSDALDPMRDEIEITDIFMRPSEVAENGVDLFIEYRPILSSDQKSTLAIDAQSLRIVIPILGV